MRVNFKRYESSITISFMQYVGKIYSHYSYIIPILHNIWSSLYKNKYLLAPNISVKVKPLGGNNECIKLLTDYPFRYNGIYP